MTLFAFLSGAMVSSTHLFVSMELAKGNGIVDYRVFQDMNGDSIRIEDYQS